MVDLPFGRPAFFHTLLASCAILTVVMLGTRGRRAVRRRLLFLPIGTFLHLVLDGIWTRSELLWWPFFGNGFPAGDLVPPLAVTALMELAGAWALGWFVWRFGLTDRQRFRYFVRTGRLTANVER